MDTSQVTQAAQGSVNATTATIYNILFLVVMFGLMYLLLIRPQQKREKKRREMINSIQVGTNVITECGICGKVINIKDDEFTIETSVEKTQLVIKKWAVREAIEPEKA